MKYSSKEQLLELDAQTWAFFIKVKETYNNCKCTQGNLIDCYESLYNAIPSSMVDYAVRATEQLLNPTISAHRPSSCDDHVPVEGRNSLEGILMTYMDYTSGKLVKKVEYTDAFIATIKGILRMLEKESIISELFPIKPYVIVVIWIAMIVELEEKHLSSTDVNKNEIARAMLAILTAFLTGVTGFIHTGGTGQTISQFITKYFKIQKSIESHCNGIYKKIPAELLIKTDQCFDTLAKEKQKSIVQALCMTYTFRIGDNLIASLSDKTGFSKEIAKKIFRSINPLPNSGESKRMYFLYSGYQIYTGIDMSDVFVCVPSNLL